MKAIQQVKTKMGTLQGTMRSAAFMRGFNDVKKNRPLDYDAYPDTNDQWRYERGRLFALIFDGPVKTGHRVNNSAVWAMGDAYRQGLIL